jgi:hypothetical protein
MADVMQAIRSIRCSSSDLEQPAWISEPGSFPAGEVLVWGKTIFHLL